MAIVGHNIYKAGVKLNTELITNNQFLVTGLTGNTNINDLTIKSVDDQGNETEVVLNGQDQVITEPLQIPTRLTKPSQVTEVIATVNSDSQITLNWDAVGGDGTVTYNILRGTTSGSLTPIDLDNSTTEYIDTGLTPETQYFYQVEAENNTGKGVLSAEINGTTLSGATLSPSTLTNIAKNSEGNTYGYVEYLPEGYNENNNYPIIFYFTGSGEVGDGTVNGLNAIRNMGIMNWLKTNDIPAIVVSPQNTNHNFGGGGGSNIMNDICTYFLNTKYVGKYNESQIHLACLSASNTGWNIWAAQNIGVINRLNSVTIQAGDNTPPQASSGVYNNVVNYGIRIWLHHGDADGTSPLNNSLAYYALLIDETGVEDFTQHRLTVYEGVGHSAWDEVYDGSGVNVSQRTGTTVLTRPAGYYVWQAPETWYDWLFNQS